MKTFFLLAALTGAAAMTATASAAPLTTTVPPYSWTGFYVGGDIGGAFQHGRGTSNFFQDTASRLANNIQQQSPKSSSLTGGVHAGFNWQFAPSWVIGIEGDWQWTRLRDSFCRQTDIRSFACSDDPHGFSNISEETRWIGTLRGRFGWAFDRWMVYGTGGVAFADIRTSLGVSCLVVGCGVDGTPNATAAESSRHKTGWAAGVGIERMLDQNWTIRAEYLHVDLGNVSTTLFLAPVNCGGSGGPCGLSWSRDLRYDVLRLGISYKFGGL